MSSVYEWILAVGSWDSVLLGTLERIMQSILQNCPSEGRGSWACHTSLQICPQQCPPDHILFLGCDLEVPLFKDLDSFSTLVEVVLYDVRNLDVKGDTASSCFSGMLMLVGSPKEPSQRNYMVFQLSEPSEDPATASTDPELGLGSSSDGFHFGSSRLSEPLHRPQWDPNITE